MNAVILPNLFLKQVCRLLRPANFGGGDGFY